MRKFFPVMALCLFLAACGKPTPMTFEQQQLQMAKEQCAQAATDFNPGGEWSGNPFWSSYFVMCMHSMGFSNEEINSLWY